MPVKLNILIVLLAFSIPVFSQNRGDTYSTDEDAGKKAAVLLLQMGANDTMHVATAILKDAATSGPIKNVDVTFYVQRSFGLMKVGNGTTDTTGTASVEFPINTRASDKSQLFTLLVKVEDNDNIRDVTAQAVVRSNIPFPTNEAVPRALIGSKAPWWMVISFWAAVGSVWAFFLYTLLLIYKIKKSANYSFTTNQKK
ncbi:hypothetical protein A3860_34295 [Niastella vici]|uniref:Cadherin domain-containing protein n=1 Tax=Niastella vici TaxID=1703345 RepID=A0A1V9FP85_9BACT|nr:hypothetical protein [Niastella vici]OQP60153.1 hypothetical protein A3860_34295 [Niastella vici]